MNLDAECHLRITETTDCGCVPVGMARTDSTVPIKLTGAPVYGERPAPPPNEHITQKYLRAYDIDLRINGTPAVDVPVPAHCMVELWVPVATDDQPADVVPSHGYVVLRHLIDGVQAVAWDWCTQHAPPADNRRPGDIMTMIAPGPVEPGTRPEWN